MKIRIIGGPGSGKTFLAEKLSKEYGIPHYDLDDIQWDNASDHYGKKRDPHEREALLNDIPKRDGWIIEGVYYAWCKQSFDDADIIYLLSVPRCKYRCRIIRRYFRRKLGMEKGKKESVKSVRALLKWADKYNTVNMAEIRSLLSEYNEKVTEQ
ncbi:MAG: AAA family ATPase [Clostridia bacterium]|nr:AAA family ATPase [Clostridia bacterium]